MRLFLTSLAFGLAGFVLVPLAVFVVGLLLAYLLDPRCGTPGDSGGCEMGMASLAFTLAIPGALGGIALAVTRHLRRRRG
ncbi:hypothetical protein NYR54_13115 [Chelativorans sp. SCAU2101]|uniref:Uncharacterized protein n=1 Tax=Chelativorans petroleitrophicus TaxID=2975484 RepID=A0A9X3B044_9HYPH|nr:hypothetical protein [Chelativorans petroleitrophicus]MCT8991220.1 hypothetical protein [Chelativorans petroleitrophicus]